MLWNQDPRSAVDVHIFIFREDAYFQDLARKLLIYLFIYLCVYSLKAILILSERCFFFLCNRNDLIIWFYLVCLSIYLSLSLCVFVFICPYVCLSVCLSVCLCICVSICLCLSACVCPSVYPPACLCACECLFHFSICLVLYLSLLISSHHPFSFFYSSYTVQCTFIS